MTRIGQGYDVHRLAEGRKLILGGVEIPYERGLLGHSDADVLTHAVMDALLGAAALDQVMQLLHAEGWQVENVDATILAQRPKLAPYLGGMADHLAAHMGVELGQVNVKATTEEGLGFTGSGEGMAAHAVCLLTKE